jgi:glycosyltransferase involved in cell wall biosynthesis
MDKVQPTIAIVTPSFNQGSYLEDAIHSVLEQDYVNVEYVIIDGNSTDNSLAVIQKHEGDKRLISWLSEPDGGQYDAINKGFARTTGEIMGWLNSDDKYMPWTFSVVADIFQTYPEIEWLTTAQHTHYNQKGQLILCRYVGGYHKKAFFKGNNLPGSWFARAVIQQEATFWRRSLWERAGGHLNAGMQLAGDFELWTRFFKLTELYAVDIPLAGIRKHGAQKTATYKEEYLIEAADVLRLRGGKPYNPFETRVRRWLWYLLGYRSFQKLPSTVGSMLVQLGLFYPVPICTWRDDRWVIAKDYTV